MPSSSRAFGEKAPGLGRVVSPSPEWTTRCRRAATPGGKPSGLALVDTRDWSIRPVAEGGANLVMTEHALLTFGYESRDGIQGYDLRSEKTFRLLPGAAGGWIQVVRGLVYAQLGDGRRFAVIDPVLRRKIGEARVTQPIILVEG
jgi:hypothetical protein